MSVPRAFLYLSLFRTLWIISRVLETILRKKAALLHRAAFFFVFQHLIIGSGLKIRCRLSLLLLLQAQLLGSQVLRFQQWTGQLRMRRTQVLMLQTSQMLQIVRNQRMLSQVSVRL